MNNNIVCKNCNEENPYYALICKKCKSYLREKIYNIDLWQILGLIIESPVKAFGIIIRSEHKNFIFFGIILASAKLFIDSMYMSLITVNPEPQLGSIISHYLVILGSILSVVFLSGIIVTLLNKLLDLKTRIRDNFAIFAYSLLPHIFGFIILFTVEATVFGGNLFSKNPSVFSLKEFLAYTLLGFEILIILWSLFLSIVGMYVQSKNIKYSIIVGVVFNLSLYYCLYLNSKILYR
jgi:hypothetical protein